MCLGHWPVAPGVPLLFTGEPWRAVREEGRRWKWGVLPSTQDLWSPETTIVSSLCSTKNASRRQSRLFSSNQFASKFDYPEGIVVTSPSFC